MQTNPEQWTRELFYQVHRAYVGEAVIDHQVGVTAAALAIQAAFAEREEWPWEEDDAHLDIIAYKPEPKP